MTSDTTGRSLFDLTPELLGELLEAWSEPSYRAGQIMRWVYERGAASYDEMSDLPQPLRARLTAELPFYQSAVGRRSESRDGTVKLLLTWWDGATSECVLIPGGERRTACLSTQVGCPVGCVFCASGLDGLQRQLSAGQIVEQAMCVRRLCTDSARLSNVVFMGLGEPLANYDATLKAVRTINASWGLSIAARKITVSTVGLPANMRKLAEERMQITLAVSLHAPNDELRRRIIPWAQRVDIESLIDAANYYFRCTGREVTLEYILLGGLNDTPQHAAELALVSKRMRANVNLIGYNPVDGLTFRQPTKQAAKRFLDALRAQGVNAHLRPGRGADIAAACGQLRRRNPPVDLPLPA